MAYMTISTIAGNPAMLNRVAACAAQEGVPDPRGWAQQNMLTLAASPGWAAAWESALASDPGTDPETVEVARDTDLGGREDVITDGMILSAVQALRG